MSFISTVKSFGKFMCDNLSTKSIAYTNMHVGKNKIKIYHEVTNATEIIRLDGVINR